MDKFFKILFLLFLITSVDVNSQENNFQNFTTSDGLPNTSINDINQDKIGYLWLATDKGYSKFDGISFTNYKSRLTSRTLTIFSTLPFMTSETFAAPFKMGLRKDSKIKALPEKSVSVN